MPYEAILTEQRGRVGIIALNRPERLNAFNYEMQAEYRDQVERWNDDASVGAIVVTGAGRAFCAGADMGGWQQDIVGREKGEAPKPRPARVENDSWTEFVMRSKPMICAINGPAIGVGLTLTLACDVRVASPAARLSMRFVRVGLIPELASTRLLAQIVGVTQALELMLSGRIIDGEEASRIGLVNRLVPAEDLMGHAIDTAAEIAANPAENLRAVKELTWANLLESSVAEVMRREDREFGAAQGRPAWKEAVSAFLEKRQPRFNET